MFSKKDIKPGMLVELLDFDEYGLYYVTLYEKGMILINNNGYYAHLKDFNDDLSHKRVNSIKILKVYGLSEYENYSLKFSTRDRELLWSIEDKIDWDEVEVDTKVLVRDRPYNEWLKRYFAKYEDGKVYVFNDGRTSWNNEGITHWEETKLWEDNN